MTEKGFSELNLEELEVLASNWAQEYDVIEKIALYRGVDADVRYMFVVSAPPLPRLDKKTREKLRSYTYIPAQEEDSLVAETIDYYNWTQTNCLHIKDDLKSAYKDLESAYKRLESDGRHASAFINEWMWYSIEPGEQVPTGMVNNSYWPIPLYEKYKETATAHLPIIVETDYSELQKHDNVFCFYGDTWHVKYNGKSGMIKDSRGMRYIAFLLDNPGSKFDPLKLSSLVDGLLEHNEKYNNMSPEQLEKEGVSLLELPIEDMTQEDKNKLEDTTLNLWESSKSGNKVDIENWEMGCSLMKQKKRTN